MQALTANEPNEEQKEADTSIKKMSCLQIHVDCESDNEGEIGTTGEMLDDNTNEQNNKE